VTGPVTVISPVPVTEKEALALFESVLSVRGLTTLSDGTVTRIVPLKEALTSGGGVTSDGLPAEGFATRLLPLRHVEAEQIQSVLEPLVSKEGALVAYPATNTIVVSDTGSNLERIARVVEALDIASHEESVEVIPLRHADAVTLAGQLADILSNPRDKAQRGAGRQGEATARCSRRGVQDRPRRAHQLPDRGRGTYRRASRAQLDGEPRPTARAG